MSWFQTVHAEFVVLPCGHHLVMCETNANIEGGVPRSCTECDASAFAAHVDDVVLYCYCPLEEGPPESYGHASDELDRGNRSRTSDIQRLQRSILQNGIVLRWHS